jgi:hypothetical protein
VPNERSSISTTVIDPKEREDVKAFCCGKRVFLPEELTPKQSLLTRLFG